MSELVLVAIMGRNRVIGAAGAQPWHFRCDLERFKALTRGHPVLMGRRTFAAIGRPLPGRTNIVLSRDPGLALEGAEVAASLEAALERAAAAPGGERIMAIGGGDLYRQCLGRAQRIELTVVDDAPEGDTHFPALDDSWRETAREAAAEGGTALSFRTYRRAPHR